MKFTKKQFKRVSALVGAVSLSVAFGVGHLLANNEKIDNTPVITVPMVRQLPSYTITINTGNVQSDYLILPIFINFNDSGNNASNQSNNQYFVNSRYTIYVIKSNEGIAISLQSFGYYYNYADEAYNFFSEGSLPPDYFQTPFYDNFSDSIKLTFLNTLYLDTHTGMSNSDIFCDFEITDSNDQSNYRYWYNNGVNASKYSYGGNYTGDFDGSVGEIAPLANYEIKIPSVASYDLGYQDGINYVLSNLTQYNLYTQSQYLAYGNSEYYRGIGESTNVLSIGQFAREIFRAPISMFSNAFNFVLPLPDGTSLNVGGILTFFLTIGIALTIVNLIMKIGGH